MCCENTPAPLVLWSNTQVGESELAIFCIILLLLLPCFPCHCETMIHLIICRLFLGRSMPRVSCVDMYWVYQAWLGCPSCSRNQWWTRWAGWHSLLTRLLKTLWYVKPCIRLDTRSSSRHSLVGRIPLQRFLCEITTLGMPGIITTVVLKLHGHSKTTKSYPYVQLM